jgi:hypothetical protein
MNKSNFFMRGAMLDNISTVAGIAFAMEAKIPATGHGSGFRRAKVMRIDWGQFVTGERLYWCLTVKPDGVSSTAFNNAEDARLSEYEVNCLAAGINAGTNEAVMLERSLSPADLWINDEQDIALCVDPTAGAGYMSAYLSVLFLGVD